MLAKMQRSCNSHLPVGTQDGTLWKTVKQFVRKLNTQLPNGPATALVLLIRMALALKRKKGMNYREEEVEGIMLRGKSSS